MKELILNTQFAGCNKIIFRGNVTGAVITEFKEHNQTGYAFKLYHKCINVYTLIMPKYPAELVRQLKAYKIELEENFAVPVLSISEINYLCNE